MIAFTNTPLSEALRRLTCAVVAAIALLGAQAAPADAQDTRSEVETLETLAFPSDQNWRQSVLIKWTDKVHFKVIADNDDDRASATEAIENVKAQLPLNLQEKILIDNDVDLAAHLPSTDRAYIYVSSNPYSNADGLLSNLLESVANGTWDVRRVIAQLQEKNPPNYTTFLARKTGELTGFLTLVNSQLDQSYKRSVFDGAVLSAIVPSLTILKTDPGLFQGERLSRGGLSLLKSVLSSSSKPGTTRQEFGEIAADVLEEKQ